MAKNFFMVHGIYEEPDEERCSLFLACVAWVVFGLRKISIFENLKQRFYPHDQTVPAWFLETYLVAYWVASGFIIWVSLTFLPVVVIPFAGLTIVQIFQTSLYHELFRPACKVTKGQSPDVAHSRLRNLLLNICNYCFVTVLFGSIYWQLRSGFGANRPEHFADYVYFSFTIAWSVGPVATPLNSINFALQVVVMTQIVITLVLVAIFIGTAVGATWAAGEKPR